MTELTIASVQYGLSDYRSEDEFWAGLASKIREASDNGAQLILFPEYVTAQLLSLERPMTHEEACYYLDGFTDEYISFFKRWSQERNLVILGGTHICKDKNAFVNKAFLFFPDGRVEWQNKLHLTPEERNRWPLAEGDELRLFDTAWGRWSILTCYDIEFPELARAAAGRGAELILCPSYTDSAHGYYRVRHCCQARAIENQVFVALGGIVGSLEEERPQIDRGYCQAGLFSPCDFPFPEKGIIQCGELNQDMLVYAPSKSGARGGRAPV
jgi:predicted amidohydrolase